MKQFGPFALRIGIGGIFLFAGIMKLMNPSMVVGMLQNLGFPGPAFWTWLLILAEVLCGAAVLVGFKLKWTTVPLAIVMIVAMSTTDQMSVVTNTLVILSGLVSLWLSGPGAWALDRS
jgi:putative oxidoreductase